MDMDFEREREILYRYIWLFAFGFDIFLDLWIFVGSLTFVVLMNHFYGRPNTRCIWLSRMSIMNKVLKHETISNWICIISKNLTWCIQEEKIPSNNSIPMRDSLFNQYPTTWVHIKGVLQFSKIKSIYCKYWGEGRVV